MAAATVATTAAGIGDLRQRNDHGDKQSNHQVEQLNRQTTYGLLQPVL
jgi:hypothetical protein